MTFIVANNVDASRSPERRPTGMPHARAKKIKPPQARKLKIKKKSCTPPSYFYPAQGVNIHTSRLSWV